MSITLNNSMMYLEKYLKKRPELGTVCLTTQVEDIEIISLYAQAPCIYLQDLDTYEEEHEGEEILWKNQ